MTHYADEPHSVQVEFFKPGGKWYTTEAVRFEPCNGLIHDSFRHSLERHLRREDGTLRLVGMIAVCLEPCHMHAHPLMVVVGVSGSHHVSAEALLHEAKSLSRPASVEEWMWSPAPSDERERLRARAVSLHITKLEALVEALMRKKE